MHHRACACNDGLTCLAPSVQHTLSSNGVYIACSLLKISQQQGVSRHISFSIFTSPRIPSLAQLSSLIARTECHGCISSGIFPHASQASVLPRWWTKTSPSPLREKRWHSHVTFSKQAFVVLATENPIWSNNTWGRCGLWDLHVWTPKIRDHTVPAWRVQLKKWDLSSFILPGTRHLLDN